MTTPGALLAALLFVVATATAQAQGTPGTDPPAASEDPGAPAAGVGSVAPPGPPVAGPLGDASPEPEPADPAGDMPPAMAAGGDPLPGTMAADAAGGPLPAPAEGTPGAADALAPTPAEKVLYDRLLGASGEGSDGDAVAPPPPGLGIEAPSVPVWLWAVGILGGLGLLFMRSRSLKALRGPDAIAVVSRSQLGKDGSLAVVEVAEADGEMRRLLVGFGGGAPRLVADLGRPFPELDPPAPAPGPLVERAEALGPRPAAARSDGSGGGVAAPRANAAGAWARAVRDAGGTVPSAPDPGGAAALLERRHDLIEEVLAERGDDDVRGVGG